MIIASVDSINTIIEEHKKEFTHYIEFLKLYEKLNNKDYEIVNENELKIEWTKSYQNNFTILKAQAIMLLYNYIESLLVIIVRDIIIKELNRLNLSYRNFNISLQTLWLRQEEHTLKLLSNHKHPEEEDEVSNDKKKEALKRSINLIKAGNSTKSLEFKYPKIKQIIQYSVSGNTDALSFRAVFALFGIKLDNNKFASPAMKEIREYRNNLAHGNQTFQQVGQNLSIRDIVDKQEEVFNFFKIILDELKVYFKRRRYAKPTRRIKTLSTP